MQLLEFTNRVLEKLGEQKVTSVLQNALAEQAAQTCRDSIVAVAQHYPNWPWLRRVVSAESWNLNRATLSGSVLALYRVMDESTGMWLTHQTEEAFYRTHLVLSVYTSSGACPYWYTMSGNDICFNPYPGDDAARGSIKFHVSIIPVLPFNDEGVVDVPVRDELMLITKACEMMALDHLADAGKAQMYGQQFQQQLIQGKTRMVTDINDQRRSAIW